MSRVKKLWWELRCAYYGWRLDRLRCHLMRIEAARYACARAEERILRSSWRYMVLLGLKD